MLHNSQMHSKAGNFEWAYSQSEPHSGCEYKCIQNGVLTPIPNKSSEFMVKNRMWYAGPKNILWSH